MTALSPGRSAHLVGSTPFDTTAEALDLALSRLGPHLRSLPDGETGERRNWIIHIVESFRQHPDLEVTREGDWSDYDRTPTFRVRPGHRLGGEALDFGHVAAFAASYPLFRERRERLGRPDLAFQVGIPGDFDMALFTLGPMGALRRRRPFTDATVSEIRRVFDAAGSDVIFQLEIPAELVFVARFPRFAQGLVARMLARGIANIARRAPAGARFGIHLCVGDMNHRALAKLRDVTPLVLLANAIAAAWPTGRPLEFIHAPFAAAVVPPSNRASFYAPLARLHIAPATRFIAGFVHEERSLEEQLRLLALLDALVGRRVDVATSCGLGRRERDAALATMERAAALCES